MGSKKKQQGHAGRPQPQSVAADKPATLRDLLGADAVAKLKERADALKQAEAAMQEAKRKEAEAARLAEQQQNENDFAYLLEHAKVKNTKYM